MALGIGLAITPLSCKEFSIGIYACDASLSMTSDNIALNYTNVPFFMQRPPGV